MPVIAQLATADRDSGPTIAPHLISVHASCFLSVSHSLYMRRRESATNWPYLSIREVFIPEVFDQLPAIIGEKGRAILRLHPK
jgi:hypothetical protein